MKIYEKVKQQLKDKHWSLSRLHEEIKSNFDEDTIDYTTLWRMIHGKTKLRGTSLFQIALALATTPQELRKGTDEEEKSIRFSYNEDAYLEIEVNKLPYLTGQLVLMAGAKTETEQDPIEKAEFTKWLFGLQGELTCVVTNEDGERRHSIKKNTSFHFRSTCPHYFENLTEKKAECILIQNPKYI